MSNLKQSEVVHAFGGSYYARTDEAKWRAGEWVTRFIALGSMAFEPTGEQFRRNRETRAEQSA